MIQKSLINELSVLTLTEVMFQRILFTTKNDLEGDAQNLPQA